MINEQFAKENNFPLWKFYKALQLFKQGVPIHIIAKRIHLNYYRAWEIIYFDMSKRVNPKRPEYVEPIVRQYYKTEDEMLIQDYKAEDLIGEEKLIFEKL